MILPYFIIGFVSTYATHEMIVVYQTLKNNCPEQFGPVFQLLDKKGLPSSLHQKLLSVSDFLLLE